METPGSQAPDKTIRDVSVPTPAGKDPRRMYIPDEIMAGYSPLQKQYWGALLEEKGEDVSVGKLVASLLLPIVLELVRGIALSRHLYRSSTYLTHPYECIIHSRN